MFPSIDRLQLTNFRTYSSLKLDVTKKLVVLTGNNGAGKTNILEAISLLSPGRGLRRAGNQEIEAAPAKKGFAVSARIKSDDHSVNVGTSLEPDLDGIRMRRCFSIDRERVSSSRRFCDYVRLVWLTPEMDRIFTGPANERRRFLDRLVLTVDADHGARANSYAVALRNRNKLLEAGATHAKWLDSLEIEIAQLGIAIAAARGETVARLNELIQDTRNSASPFPWAVLNVNGGVDDLVRDLPAIDAEDQLCRQLAMSRTADARAGRALIGPQTSDLNVINGLKSIPVALSSTGEQKALLTGMILAHSSLVAAMSGQAPIVLLDEIAAHFDPIKRNALFQELQDLGAQTWMTGADERLFDEISMQADIFRIADGDAEKQSS